MKITFIQTGGTIDKDYPQGITDHGYAFTIGEPAVVEVLERIKPLYPIEVIKHLAKDSLDMDDDDRQSIKELVEGLKDDRIVITHGTDTIGLTAEALAEVSGKTVVLTGSMMPEKFRYSDADFNVGMAIGGAQQLPYGIYVALHGQLQKWDEFVK